MINIPPELLTNARMHYTYLHEHPELSFAEEQTAAYIRRTLDCLQIQYTNAGPTGIIGFLPGRDTSRTIALRADFDALPISEKEDHPLISRNPGIMHACGHDLHTAVLLGTAEILATRSLPFNLMFIFQHGEEVLPGGARDIIGNVFFQTHLPEWIIALHAEPDLPVAQLGICPGQYMASGDIHHPARPGRTCRLTRPIGRPDPDRFPYRRGSAADYQPERLSLHSYRPDFRSFQMPQHDEHHPQRSPARRDFPHFRRNLAPGG